MNYLRVGPRLRLVSRLLRPATCLFALVLVSTLSLHAADAGTGAVIGAVTSSTTRNALQGATVSVPAVNRTEFTDSSGSFSLRDLPAGPVDIVISYTGFTEERRSITVRPGEATRLDAEMRPAEALVMDAFTVATEREGQALSITEQRNAANIKNVSALDEWGNLPTLSVGELAMRLPGITFTTDEDNLVNNVSIRGMPAGYTRLNIDGMSSTGVGGDGRSATLHSFSGAMYEQIEIIAGQTPDKRADSLGGQLNLKTKSPLSMSEKRRFNYNLGARWAPPFAERTQQRGDHPIHPVGSLSYQERFDAFGGSRNLGIALNASYTESVNPIDLNTLLYQSTTDPVAFFNDYTVFTGLNHRMITGLSLRADYRVSPRTNLSLRLLYNAGAEPYYDRVRVNPWTSVTTAAAINAAIVPGYTENRTEIRPVAASVMDLEMWRFSFYSRNPTGTIAAEHDFGRVKLDYAARWSNTHWESGAGKNRQGGQLTMRAPSIGFALDKSDLDGRVFTQLSGRDVYDVASYTSNIVYTKRDTITDTNEVSGTLNASYLLPTELPVTLKAGLDTVNRRVNNRQVSPRRWNRVAGAPALTGALMPVTRFEEQHGQRLPTIDPSSINDQLGNPALWTEDINFAATQPYTNRRIMEEAVDSAYIQGTARIRRFTLLGGVRVEDVEVDSFTFGRFQTTPVAAEPDPFVRARRDFGAVSDSGGYTKLFPSVHVAYDFTSNLKGRASWSMSYGRPTLAQIVALSINDTTQTVTSGNPALKPQVADNIDLKLEYYFGSNGLLSFGVFQKDIEDYVLNRGAGIVSSGPDNGYDGNYSGYALIAPFNAGTAKVKGWEADYRQRLTFLPGALKGLTLAANYTWIETTGKFTGVTDIAKNDVAGFIPKAGNLRLLYNYRKFSASAGLNFTGRHIHPLSPITPAANRFYRRDLTTVNAGVSYRLRPQATLSLDVNNIFEEGPSQYRFIESRTRSEFNAGMTVSIGLSGQF